MKHVTAVAGILWRNGRYLAAERPAGKIMAGYWEFPGGKVEEGETPDDALIRELREELGITATSAVFWRTIDHINVQGHITLHLFHVPEFTGDPSPLEGQKLAWLDPAVPPARIFLPVDQPLVRELGNGQYPPALRKENPL